MPTNIELDIIIPRLVPRDGDLLKAGVRRFLGVREGGVHGGGDSGGVCVVIARSQLMKYV